MPPPLQALVVIVSVGAILRSSGVLSKAHAEQLASLVFSVSLPATILVSLDRVSFSPAAWKVPLAACLVTLPMVLCSWQICRLLQLPRQTQGAFLLATGSINSVYFAYPVMIATLGDEGLARAILFDLGQTTLTLTFLYAVALWHGVQSSSPRLALFRFLASPPLWTLACVLTLKIIGLHLPIWLRELLIPLHLTTTPLASLVLGLSIGLSAVRQTWPLALLGVIVRMGGGLSMGILAAHGLELTGVDRVVVILVASMPSAVSAVIFAAETGLDEELVASIVALSICLGVAILPWLPRLAMMVVG